MNTVENHPESDENFEWFAKATDISTGDAEVLQQLFNDRLSIRHDKGNVIIAAPDRGTQRELEIFMNAAILFQKRRVHPKK